MKRHLILITLFSIFTQNIFAERFINVSTKKMKITIIDKATKAKIKQFDLKPLHPEDIDLSKYTQGVMISVKTMRGSYLAERKVEDMCQDCGKKVESVCGCKTKPAKKEKKDQDVEIDLGARDMNKNNEFIILISQDELKIKVIEPVQESRLERIKNKDNKTTSTHSVRSGLKIQE